MLTHRLPQLIKTFLRLSYTDISFSPKRIQSEKKETTHKLADKYITIGIL